MAQTTASVIVAGATVEMSAYVTAGGAGTFTEVGHTSSPTELQGTFEDVDITSEQVPGIVAKRRISSRYTLKFRMMETVLENWRQAMRQAAANLTGTPPDMTLLVGAGAEQYHQIQIVGTGVGTTGVRTLTAWKFIVTEMAPIAFAKGAPQEIEITGELCYDESVATADKFFKAVDA